MLVLWRCSLDPLFAFGQGRLIGVNCEVKGSSTLFTCDHGQRQIKHGLEVHQSHVSLSLSNLAPLPRIQVVPRPALW